MTLVLREDQSAQIREYLQRAYPEEGCGVMLGGEQDGRREVARIVAFENQREDSRHNRYLISPEQFLAAERAGREQGLDVLGFFHSHPDHPAEPSAFDLEHAWPYYSYVIVSVLAGRIGEMRSFRLADDRSHFDTETIELLEGAAGAPGPAGEIQ